MVQRIFVNRRKEAEYKFQLVVNAIFSQRRKQGEGLKTRIKVTGDRRPEADTKEAGSRKGCTRRCLAGAGCDVRAVVRRGDGWESPGPRRNRGISVQYVGTSTFFGVRAAFRSLG